MIAKGRIPFIAQELDELEQRGDSPANLIAQAAHRLMWQVNQAIADGTFDCDSQVYELNHLPAIVHCIRAYRALV